MLGTLHTRPDGRYELRFERRLAHPVAKVWRPSPNRSTCSPGSRRRSNWT